MVARLAMGAGVLQEDAAILAEALVDAELHGASTHGVSRLAIYMQRMQRGLIDPQAPLNLTHSHRAVRVYDANHGLGQVQAVKVLDEMAPLARRHGVAVATVKNSQHFGALSYYCNRMAADGFILLAMTNCEPAMAPTGGRNAYFGTNPLAASFPTGKGFPIKIDLATSIVARGNIIAANKQGNQIPEGWALDPAGNPTTDPAAALQGSVLTMAGHKGYALAMMVEMFAGVLSGANVGSGVGSMYKDLDQPQGVGHFFCLLDIEAFQGLDTFTQRTDRTIDELKQVPCQPGVDEILVPGERSSRVAERHRREGILLQAVVCRELKELCEAYKVPFPSPILATPDEEDAS